jgi:hypothetical protein
MSDECVVNHDSILSGAAYFRREVEGRGSQHQHHPYRVLRLQPAEQHAGFRSECLRLFEFYSYCGLHNYALLST